LYRHSFGVGIAPLLKSATPIEAELFPHPGLSMPSHIFDDPEHWRQRAEQARALAEQMNDTASREMMLGIAKDYERLAEQAEQRAQEKRKKKES
jgi:hypothetical protein